MVQKTYILTLATDRHAHKPGHAHSGHASNSVFGWPRKRTNNNQRLKIVAQYGDPFGAAIDFNLGTERRILDALGELLMH